MGPPPRQLSREEQRSGGAGAGPRLPDIQTLPSVSWTLPSAKVQPGSPSGAASRTSCSLGRGLRRNESSPHRMPGRRQARQTGAPGPHTLPGLEVTQDGVGGGGGTPVPSHHHPLSHRMPVGGHLPWGRGGQGTDTHIGSAVHGSLHSRHRRGQGTKGKLKSTLRALLPKWGLHAPPGPDIAHNRGVSAAAGTHGQWELAGIGPRACLLPPCHSHHMLSPGWQTGPPIQPHANTPDQSPGKHGGSRAHPTPRDRWQTGRTGGNSVPPWGSLRSLTWAEVGRGAQPL